MTYRWNPRRRRLTELEQTETRTARKMAELLRRLGLIEENEKVRVVRCRPRALAEERWRVVLCCGSIGARF